MTDTLDQLADLGIRFGGPMFYKLTGPKGEPVHGGSGNWSRPRGQKPGAWREATGKLVPCVNGLHLLRVGDLGQWLRTGVLWEVEAGTEQIDHGDKIVVRRARLVRKVATIDAKTLRLLAADFTENVLPIFEKKRPNDLRPREAIAAARAYARGEIGLGELREKRGAAAAASAASAYDAASAAAAYDAAYAASAAAYAAADAADAAAYAAAYAADAAAYAADAADAASAAAYAAARSKERAWQAARIAEVLGLETP